MIFSETQRVLAFEASSVYKPNGHLKNFVLKYAFDSVSREPRRSLDQGELLSEQSIEEHTLADIRPTYDADCEDRVF